jgi:hypothetical protein
MSELDELIDPCAMTVAGALVSVVLLYPDVRQPADAYRRAHELVSRAFGDALAAANAADSEPPPIVT